MLTPETTLVRLSHSQAGTALAGSLTHPEGAARLQVAPGRQYSGLPLRLIQGRDESRRRQRRRRGRLAGFEAQSSRRRSCQATAAGGRFSQRRAAMMEIIPGQCAEGDEGQVRECREGRPQDLEGAEGQVPGGRRPPGNRGFQIGYRVLSSRRATLSGELSAAAPCARVEKGTGLEYAVREDHPHVQVGPEPAVGPRYARQNVKGGARLSHNNRCWAA